MLSDSYYCLHAPSIFISFFECLNCALLVDDSDGDSGDELYVKAEDDKDDDEEEEEDDYDARNGKRTSSRGSRAAAKPRAPTKAVKPTPKKAPPTRASPTAAGRGKQKSHANDDEIEDDQDQEEQWDKPQRSSKQVVKGHAG